MLEGSGDNDIIKFTMNKKERKKKVMANLYL